MTDRPRQGGPEGLTTTQAARLCGVDRRTILRYVQSGQLTSYRTPGGHYRIRPEELSAFMDALGLTPPEALAPVRPRIAIIEDEQHQVRALTRRIRMVRPDAEVRSASDGFAGGLLVADWVPDLVFLDLVMPGLDGFEVCRLIRASQRLEGVSIVIQSGIVDAEVRERLAALGADVILRKPLEHGVVEDVLRELLPRTAGLRPKTDRVPGGGPGRTKR